MSQKRVRPFPRFLVVGTAGFAVDAGLMFLLTSMGGDPYLMRMGTFVLAVAVTWAGNRYWSFVERNAGNALASFGKYVGVQSVGLAVNYLAFAGVLLMIAPTPVNAALAAILGSVAALVFNYLGASKLVFRDKAQA